MTFDETKSLLQDIKNAKQRVRSINEEIQECVSIRSSLSGNEGRGKGGVSSPVEQIVLRIEEHQLSLENALIAVFELEDKLAEAIKMLSPIEQDIIIGYYMHSRVHWKLANDLGYSERQLRRIKGIAIKKISGKI